MTTLTLFIKPSSRNVLIRDLAVINWVLLSLAARRLGRTAFGNLPFKKVIP